MSKRYNLTGQKFGKWTVLSIGERVPGHTSVFWNCICDAGYHRWLENKMADLYKKEHFLNAV